MSAQSMIRVSIVNNTDQGTEVTFAMDGHTVGNQVPTPQSPPPTDHALPGPGNYTASANGMTSNVCQVEDGKVYRVVLGAGGIRFDETKKS